MIPAAVASKIASPACIVGTRHLVSAPRGLLSLPAHERDLASPSRQSVDHFREARVVRITLGGFAIWLDPFGMLDPQIAVNPLLEFGIRMDWTRHGNRPR